MSLSRSLINIKTGNCAATSLHNPYLKYLNTAFFSCWICKKKSPRYKEMQLIWPHSRVEMIFIHTRSNYLSSVLQTLLREAKATTDSYRVQVWSKGKQVRAWASQRIIEIHAKKTQLLMRRCVCFQRWSCFASSASDCKHKCFTKCAKLVSELVYSETLITSWHINVEVSLFVLLVSLMHWRSFISFIVSLLFHQLNLINRGQPAKWVVKTNPGSFCRCQWLVKSLANSVI